MHAHEIYIQHSWTSMGRFLRSCKIVLDKVGFDLSAVIKRIDPKKTLEEVLIERGHAEYTDEYGSFDLEIDSHIYASW